MKQILLVSDSHRDDETLQAIFDQYPDLPVFHCGDVCLEKDNPLIARALVVMGNHDFYPFDEYLVKPPFFICHGHTLGVYHSFDRMIEKAKEHHCHTIIHGHTHIPYDNVHDGIRIINPGSTMINRGSYGFGTYAILDTETGKLNFHHHITHEIVNEIVIEDGKKTLAEFRDLIQQFHL